MEELFKVSLHIAQSLDLSRILHDHHDIDSVAKLTTMRSEIFANQPLVAVSDIRIADASAGRYAYSRSRLPRTTNQNNEILRLNPTPVATDFLEFHSLENSRGFGKRCIQMGAFRGLGNHIIFS